MFQDKGKRKNRQKEKCEIKKGILRLAGYLFLLLLFGNDMSKSCHGTTIEIIEPKAQGFHRRTYNDNRRPDNGNLQSTNPKYHRVRSMSLKAFDK